MSAKARRKFLTTSMAGAAAFAGRPRGASAQGKVTLRFASGTTPGHPRSRACDLFAKRVGELTKDEVTIRVYHDGVLGSEGQVAEALQTGTVDIGAIVLFTNAMKLGQVMSTRTDLISPQAAAELGMLQDHVRPAPRDGIATVLEEELDAPVSEVFRGFDWKPVAAASTSSLRPRPSEGPSPLRIAMRVISA